MAAEDRRREKKINLAALRTLDKYAANILDTASSVAHYVFDANSEKWEKTDFEGSLFVYNRNEKRTEVAFLIMNRLKKENFHITINSGMEFKTQDPFLLCRTSSEIIGIWFYNSAECARISALLSRIAELADDEDQLKSEIDEALEVLEKREEPKVDVLTMFVKAKEEYDKKNDRRENINKSASMPRFMPTEQKRPVTLTRTNSVPDGIHEEVNEEEEGGISMISHSNKEESNCLMELLQRAKKEDRKSRARTLSYGESQVSESSRDFRENIKRLGKTKAGDLAFVENSYLGYRKGVDLQKPQVIDVAKLEASVLLNQKQDIPREEQEPEIKRDRPEDMAASSVVPKETNRMGILSTDLLSPAKITPTKQTALKLGKGRGKGLATALSQYEAKPGEKIAAVTVPNIPGGTMLKAAAETQKTPRKDTISGIKFPDPPSTGAVASLMSPMQFIAASKSTASQSNISSMELDKQQFKDAFINLLQTDDGLVEMLHKSYLSIKSKR